MQKRPFDYNSSFWETIPSFVYFRANGWFCISEPTNDWSFSDFSEKHSFEIPCFLENIYIHVHVYIYIVFVVCICLFVRFTFCTFISLSLISLPFILLYCTCTLYLMYLMYVPSIENKYFGKALIKLT